MVDKKEIENLMVIADKVLRERNNGIVADMGKCEIYDSYNGQIAALGVSISMIGLVPTLAIYYQDKPEKNDRTKPNKKIKPNRRTVLKVIVKMLDILDESYGFDGNPRKLLEYAIDLRNKEGEFSKKLNSLKKRIVSSAVALKHIVRTYSLVPYEK